MPNLQHDGRRYVWSGSYAERILPKEAGFRWDPEAKLWWTNDHRKAESLIDYMAASALDARAAWKETLQASRATDSEIVIPAPDGLEYLPYQKAGIAYAASRQSVLIGDEMGLGKTIQALGLINLDTIIQTVLIVAPKSLLLNWQREAEKWLTRSVDLTVINYDMVWKRADLTERTWDLVVYDESQHLKNPKAKRTVASLAIPAKRRVFLTGTPILNRPVGLWPMVNAIDPDGMGKSFFGFAQRYCGAKQIRAGRKMVWDFTGASNLEELQDKMRQGFMVRRLKADVLKELPAKRRQIIPLEANGASRILKAEQQLISQLGFEEAALALEGKSAAFTEMAKLRHELGVAKVEKALDHIKDMLDSVEKVIVFAHHHDVIDGLRDGLSEYGLVTVTGQTPGADRQAAVDRFQADPTCRVFLGNIKAAGVGLTLTAASTVVFVESDWTPGWMQQAEDRAHRIGQTESVLVQYLVFDGSMDAVLAQTLVSKADISDRALDREVDPKDLSDVIEQIQQAAPRATTEQEAPAMSEAQIDAVMLGLRILAGMCDGAREKDGVGFNGLDTGFGHRLAGLPALSQRQALVAKKMIRKYHRQLGQELINQM